MWQLSTTCVENELQFGGDELQTGDGAILKLAVVMEMKRKARIRFGGWRLGLILECETVEVGILQENEWCYWWWQSQGQISGHVSATESLD